MASASEIVKKLNLLCHTEGGFYWETFRDASVTLSTSHLPSGYVLELNESDGQVKLTKLGSDLIGGKQQAHYPVPPNIWFGAFPTKDYIISPDGAVAKTASRDPESHYSLVGYTCASAFQFEDFELARRSHLISRFPKHEQVISLLAYPD